MADLTHPDTTHPEEPNGAADDAAPAEPVSLADLGEASIHLFIMLAGFALVTPLGNVAVLAALFGLVILVLGSQLVMRLPFIALPGGGTGMIEQNAWGQAGLTFLERNKELWLSHQRRSAHWLMVRPFDIFPRILLAVTGVVVILTASVPAMAHVLGVVALLISVSLMARNMIIFFMGAAILSWSSVLPLLNN